MHWFQSTPGITAGRHPLGLYFALYEAPFQSTPGITAGRHLRVCVVCAVVVDVSIHARHHCRATLPKSTSRDSDIRFQSTPGITAGRHTRVTLMAPARSWFQSTPGITAGRHAAARYQPLRLGLVSIHARHHCRATPPEICSEYPDTSGFNPRPASLPGDTQPDPAGRQAHRVSIHARHHCRATLPNRQKGRWNRAVSIHARHHCRATQRNCWCGSRTTNVSIHARHHCRATPVNFIIISTFETFQSTPGITAGRHLAGSAGLGVHARFNPRPASLPGDT